MEENMIKNIFGSLCHTSETNISETHDKSTISSIQLLSHVWLSATPWTAARQASCHQLPEFTQTSVHRVGDAIQPSHPLSSPSPPAFNLSQHQGVFWWISSSHEMAKVLELRISPSNEYSGLISFRIDWFDPLAVQGILKSLLQHHSSKASILQHSAFFMCQLSGPYVTPGKTITLIRWTFVSQVMFLLFNMLSRLVVSIKIK